MDKGFELQFSWIFVLIAGAVIMSFFFVLIKNQISSGETDSAREAQQDLSFILRVSQGTSNTEKVIAFNKPIEFMCSDISEYRVRGADISGRYDYQVVFAPELLEGRELVVSTSSLRSPFRVMSVAYVTNKDIDHVFVGNDPVVGKLYRSMPQNSSKRLIANLQPNYPDDNFDSVVFVMSRNTFNLGITLNELREADFVVVDYESITQGAYGTVGFYHYDGSLTDKGVYPYVGDEMLKGAITTHSGEMYYCNVHKVAQRINLLAKLHKTKIDKMLGDPACDSYYASLSASLENLRVTTDAWPITNDGMKKLYEESTDLAAWNSEVTQRTSCTPLY